MSRDTESRAPRYASWYLLKKYRFFHIIRELNQSNAKAHTGRVTPPLYGWSRIRGLQADYPWMFTESTNYKTHLEKVSLVSSFVSERSTERFKGFIHTYSVGLMTLRLVESRLRSSEKLSCSASWSWNIVSPANTRAQKPLWRFDVWASAGWDSSACAPWGLLGFSLTA